jgi:hypothetical protein
LNIIQPISIETGPRPIVASMPNYIIIDVCKVSTVVLELV